jgi:hypothetical protein
LDNVVAHIDAPRLERLYITFFDRVIFDTPHFNQFISRTPRLKAPEEASVVFNVGVARVDFSSDCGWLEVKIPCRELDRQLSSMVQICTSCLPPLSTLDDLYIDEDIDAHPEWQDNIRNMQWLELLHPFTTVKNLHLFGASASRIIPALQDPFEGRTTEVLPTLECLHLKPFGPVQEGVYTVSFGTRCFCFFAELE